MTGVRIACAQLELRVGDPDHNLAAVLGALDEAAAAGAGIVVVPELATSGYVFHDADEARSLAEPVDGPSLRAWAERAREHDLVVVGGFCEAGDDGLLYNSAAIVDGSGVLAAYRKAHLWDREKLVFTPGAEAPPVVETRHGRLSVMVCYDLEFPEWVRAAALAGADLLCVPTNWPDEGRPAGERPMEVLRAMVAAASNHMYVAACDRCGAERGVEWVAGTAIADPDGWLLAGPPAAPEPELLLADADLSRSRAKAIGPRNDVHADRRPELYGAVAGAPVG